MCLQYLNTVNFLFVPAVVLRYVRFRGGIVK
jgi:hypothetical protein